METWTWISWIIIAIVFYASGAYSGWKRPGKAKICFDLFFGIIFLVAELAVRAFKFAWKKTPWGKK